MGRIQNIIQMADYIDILRAQEKDVLVVLKEMLHKENIFCRENIGLIGF